MTTTGLDELHAAAERASARGTQAQARAEQAAVEEAARQAVRAQEYDDRVLVSIDVDALRQAAEDALIAVETTIVEGGNAFTAWLDYRMAHKRWWELASEANAAASRRGHPPVSGMVPSAYEDFDAVLRRAASAHARRVVEAELAERFDARQRYIEGSG